MTPYKMGLRDGYLEGHAEGKKAGYWQGFICGAATFVAGLLTSIVVFLIWLY